MNIEVYVLIMRVSAAVSAGDSKFPASFIRYFGIAYQLFICYKNIYESGGIMSSGLDVTRNLRIIENLKSELLEGIAALYRHLADPVLEDTRDVAADTLSEMIVISYLLGKRLGVDYSTMDRHISKKIRLGLINENEIEKYFGDLSELARMRSGEVQKR